MIGRGLALGITLLLCGLLGAVTAEAQQAAKVARIGYLGSKMSVPHNHEAFSKDCVTLVTSRVATS